MSTANQESVAIVDIGSNSVRLVVYAGPTRIPAIVFNEKVMAGLGKGVGPGEPLTAEAQDRALSALERFYLLTRQMGVSHTRVVATAAVRDASNGAEFLARVRAIGFKPELLTGKQEGLMAGQGVLSAIPEADGIVGDLGGGSLELVDVRDGKVRRSASLPLGVLRIAPLLKKRDGALARKVARAVEEAGFAELGRKRPFYMVGGSWRALARFDMLLTHYPLPITHHYSLAPRRLPELERTIEEVGKADLKTLPSMSVSRVPALPAATALLGDLVDTIRPSALIASSFGIREGLLYDALSPAVRKVDPLIAAARQIGAELGRFPEHGDVLDRWIGPIFGDDPPAMARLRLAASLLSDIAWQTNPDFRAERGVEIALHGNWVGIDGPGRVIMAQALFSNFGGGRSFGTTPVAKLCTPEQLTRASQWGLAMRLAQRLSGGLVTSLERSRLVRKGDMLRLELRREDEALYGETVERRHKTLANALGLSPVAVMV
jgi:exopolyphosphatase/guanosine-5'-triphosphate,3'-diphosphate pyrophosphatase